MKLWSSPPVLPDVAAFRDAVRETPLRGRETLLASDRWSASRAAEAERTLSAGWRIGRQDRVPLAAPLDWENLCRSNRSWRYHLFAWEPLALPLAAHDALGDGRYLELCASVALDWVRRYPEVDADDGFAWYDMAVGLRAYRLGYLLDVMARDDAWEDQDVGDLMASAVTHAGALRDGAFAAHSNHGLYQAAGQTALAARFPQLPGMDEALVQGRERLTEMLRSQFAADGVHLEHSPGYHHLLLDSAEQLLAHGLLDGLEATGIVRRARAAYAWFVMPDGRLPLIGDTSRRLAGVAPAAGRVGAFPDGGFAVLREGPSYVAQIAAFHSRAHKHADDLSFVWSDRGHELLVDSGRYGYLGRIGADTELGRLGFTYGDPNRIYVESTRAHNSVEVDGTSHPRRVEPYGSALRGWGDDGAVLWTDCCATVHETITHRRILVLFPGSWVVVVDHLEDGARRTRRFSQRWHLAPELDVAEQGAAVRAAVPGEEEGLWVVPLTGGAARTAVARGQEEPMLGWISREPYEMIPAPTLAFERDGTACAFATLIAFAREAPAALAGSTAAAPAWSAGGTAHRLDLTGAGAALRVRHETS